MTFPQILFCAIFGYLVGGFSSAITLSIYTQKQDVRDVGSQNAGATNMLRSFGWRAGLTTFFCDVIKGAFATAMGLWSFDLTGAVICGVAAIVGHVFPIYYGFRGGKGVSATVGMMLVLAPGITAITMVLVLVLVYFSRIVSIGSLVGNAVLVALSWCFVGDKLSVCIGITAVFALNLFSHRKNIQRLINGTENKMHWQELSAASRIEMKKIDLRLNDVMQKTREKRNK